MRAFLAELRRRRVFRFTVLYAAVAFVMLQVADLVLPAMTAPPWTYSLLVVLALFGFPIGFALAWAFDITPEGIKRTEPEGKKRTEPEARVADSAWAAARGADGAEAGAAEAKPEAAAEPPAPRQLGPIASPDGPDDSQRTHLLIMPFRSLRADPDTDFLCFSLPDAIGCSLSGLRSLVVRSRLAADHAPGAILDLGRLAVDLRIDAVLTGTLMRVGDRLRVAAQVAQAPGGEIVWSQISDVDFDDLFALQDELSNRILESLSVSLSRRERRRLRRDAPASASMYEAYLRANQLVQHVSGLPAARELYLQCLQEDPNYASAWARLGHCYRLTGKWAPEPAMYHPMLEQAEVAFRRAFELNPDLPLAHNLYTPLEVERGRSVRASTRLLGRAKEVGGDPNLFAGLVHVCRFSGLLEASAAAHVRARRLDPSIRTSVGHTYFMLGYFEDALKASPGDIGYLGPLSLAALGQGDAALRLAAENEATASGTTAHAHLVSLKAMLEGDRELALTAAESALRDPRDPEAHFYAARHLAYLGDAEAAIAEFERLFDMGYCCARQLRTDAWLEPIHQHPRFPALLAETEAAMRGAQAAFVAAGGHAVLGPIPTAA